MEPLIISWLLSIWSYIHCRNSRLDRSNEPSPVLDPQGPAETSRKVTDMYYTSLYLRRYSTSEDVPATR